MDITQIKVAIQALPPEAQTKPLLAALAEQVESLSSNPAIAALRQEVADVKRNIAPQHPVGLCQDSGCGNCVQAAQEFVSAGRQSFMGDLDSALYWANRPDIAEIITELYDEWGKAGRPMAPRPAAV